MYLVCLEHLAISVNSFQQLINKGVQIKHIAITYLLSILESHLTDALFYYIRPAFDIKK